jgi:menaquinone-specific isochorismate synthase
VVAPPTPMTGAIDQALGDIKDGTLEKIVLAQTQDLIAPQPLSITRSLANLRHQYPDCYTFALGDGAGHGFLGASPERLLAIHRGQLTCDALAGSAARGEDVVADRALATALLADPKEQREHSLVREFIIQRLQKLHLQPQWPDRSQLLQLKNIQHIWTPITAPVSAQLSPLEILAQLHPTPAVAGLPQALACEKIQAYEPIDRGLYAAPVGWVDGVGNSEWIVGIRSALVQGAQARLYAGAGLVAGSDAGQELAEIQLKFQPLYRALSV